MKIILLLLTISFASCTTTKLVYVEPKPYTFQQTTETPKLVIRVHNDDVELYRAYIKSFRDKLKFHNNQIIDYKNSFKN